MSHQKAICNSQVTRNNKKLELPKTKEKSPLPELSDDEFSEKYLSESRKSKLTGGTLGKS